MTREPTQRWLAAVLGACVLSGCHVAVTHWVDRVDLAPPGAQSAPGVTAGQPAPVRTVAGPVDVLGRFAADSPVRFAGSAASGLIQHTFAPEGEDRDPDVRGGLLVFSSTRHSTHPNLYLLRTDGGPVVQLTGDAFDNIQPALSPDGRRVAFASNRNGNWDIFVLDLATDRRASAAGPAEEGTQPATGAGGAWPFGPDPRQPAPSGAEWPAPEDGQPILQVTDSEDHEVHPTWSPDGRRLAYSCLSSRSGRWEIFVVDVDAGTRRRMLVTEGLFPVWSRTGRLAFQRARDRGAGWFGVWAVTLSEDSVSRAAEIVSGADWAAIAPAWSEDGSRLVFATVNRDRLARSSAGLQYADSLWIVRADGTERIRLTPAGESASAPVWGDDGRVYFVSDRSGRRHIWSLRPVAAPTGPVLDRPAVAQAAKPDAGG